MDSGGRLPRAIAREPEIISFGLAYNLERDDLARLREESSDGDAERQRRMAEYVEWTGLDGVFEVIDEVRWGV